MRSVFVVLALLFALPLQAAGLKFQFGGMYRAGEDSPPRPFNVSYQLNTAPTDFSYADVTDPGGTVVPNYLTGVPLFRVSTDSSGSAPFPYLDSLLVQFGGGAPLNLRPFSLTQGISSNGFNRYQYHFDLWVAGDAFGFLHYDLDISPRPEDGVWDRSFIESLSDPSMLLAHAAVGEASPAYMELSQFNLSLDVNRFSISAEAAQISEPSTLALNATGLFLLLIALGPRMRRSAGRRA